MNVDAPQLVKDFWNNNFDFSSGVSIEKDIISKWIHRSITMVVDRMDKDPLLNEDYSSISSGKVKVMVFAIKISPGEYEIEILVIDSYKSYTEHIIDTNYAFRT